MPTQRWQNITTIALTSRFSPPCPFHRCVYGNIISYVLDIPYNLYQVCPPGLHITLGIFLRLFVLLEDVCHHLDLTAELNGSEGGRSFERYSAALRQQRALRDEVLSVQRQLTILEQSATYTMVVNPNIASLPIFHQLTTEISTRKGRLQQLVSLFKS